MKNEIIFYSNPMSRGRTVHWMLEEIGCTYKTEVVEYGASMKAPAYLAINPMGKVPALRHGDLIVTEVAAICAYLADAFPAANLAPAIGDAHRGSYYRWLFFAAGPIEYAVSNRALGFAVPEGRERMMGYGSYELTMKTLESAIQKALDAEQYLAGKSFSAADLYVGSHLGFGLQFGTLEKRPAFEQYWQKLSARPAYLKASKIDEQATAEMQKKI